MKFFRSERVGKLIREELAKLIIREVEIPGALATITEVNVEKKLDYARVKVSIIPSEKAPQALKALERQAGHLQHLITKKVNIKPMPRIAFEIDHGYENAAAIEKRLLEE